MWTKIDTSTGKPTGHFSVSEPEEVRAYNLVKSAYQTNSAWWSQNHAGDLLVLADSDSNGFPVGSTDNSTSWNEEYDPRTLDFLLKADGGALIGTDASKGGVAGIGGGAYQQHHSHHLWEKTRRKVRGPPGPIRSHSFRSSLRNTTHPYRLRTVC